MGCGRMDWSRSGVGDEDSIHESPVERALVAAVERSLGHGKSDDRRQNLRSFFRPILYLRARVYAGDGAGPRCEETIRVHDAKKWMRFTPTRRSGLQPEACGRGGSWRWSRDTKLWRRSTVGPTFRHGARSAGFPVIGVSLLADARGRHTICEDTLERAMVRETTLRRRRTRPPRLKLRLFDRLTAATTLAPALRGIGMPARPGRRRAGPTRRSAYILQVPAPGFSKLICACRAAANALNLQPRRKNQAATGIQRGEVASMGACERAGGNGHADFGYVGGHREK